MTTAEAAIVAVWAIGFVASLFFCWRFARKIPPDERNDPFMVCLMWPLVVLFLGAFLILLFLGDATFNRRRA